MITRRRIFTQRYTTSAGRVRFGLKRGWFSGLIWQLNTAGDVYYGCCPSSLVIFWRRLPGVWELGWRRFRRGISRLLPVGGACRILRRDPGGRWSASSLLDPFAGRGCRIQRGFRLRLRRRGAGEEEPR